MWAFAGGESAKACWLLTMSTTLRKDDGSDFLVLKTGCAETGLMEERCAITRADVWILLMRAVQQLPGKLMAKSGSHLRKADRVPLNCYVLQIDDVTLRQLFARNKIPWVGDCRSVGTWKVLTALMRSFASIFCSFRFSQPKPRGTLEGVGCSLFQTFKSATGGPR